MTGGFRADSTIAYVQESDLEVLVSEARARSQTRLVTSIAARTIAEPQTEPLMLDRDTWPATLKPVIESALARPICDPLGKAALRKRVLVIDRLLGVDSRLPPPSEPVVRPA